MPDSLATRCGSMASSKQAWMIAAEIESWPQPAHSVETVPFIVAMGEAQLVHRDGGMAQLRLDDIGHSAASLDVMVMRSAIRLMMKRAVIGVPS